MSLGIRESRASIHREAFGLLVMALFVGRAPAALAAGDIVLTMREGPGSAEVSLSWSGSGLWFDVRRSADAKTILDAPNRIGSTDVPGWADWTPPDPTEFYLVTSSAPGRMPFTPLEPFFLIVADSSGSMTGALAAPPAPCPGAGASRLDHLRCALSRLVEARGELVPALARFRESTIDGDCSDGCMLTGIDCTGCVPSTGAGCTAAMGSDARIEILVPLRDGAERDLAKWVDFSCTTCDANLGLDPEHFAGGFGPIAGPLLGAKRYFQGLQASDGTTLWPSGSPGFDPIRSDPSLPFAPGCRPYVVVLIVDGNETCASYAAGEAAAGALLATDVDTGTHRIETRVVALGVPPGDPEFEALAHAGGAGDATGANEAFYPQEAEELRQVLEALAAEAARREICNGVDDDCDGLVDEDFPEKGRPCRSGGFGVCAGSGTLVCRADGLGLECQVTLPGGSPAPEACNTLDDDCDGAIDEGCPPCVETETCGNFVDDDCDGAVDEGCGSCAGWVSIGGGFEIMRWEASRRDATPTSAGVEESDVCSRPGVLPWTNLTRPQAEAACAAIGARLCSELEWHRVCAVVQRTSWPVTEPGAANGQMFFEAEDFAASTTATGPDSVVRAFVPDATPGRSGIAAVAAWPDRGVSVPAASAPSQSPRLDYEITFTTAGSHYVWVRMFGPSSSGNALHVGISATPGTMAPTQTIATTTTGTWEWRRTGALNVPTGTRFVSLYMQEDGLRVDAILVTRSTSTTAPTTTTGDGGHWAFAVNSDVYQPAACNGADYDTDPSSGGNDDEVLTTGALFAGGCYAAFAGSPVDDLSGNVKEWTALRLPNVAPLRGGASNNLGEGISCAAVALADDVYAAPNVGFRCCR